MIERTAMTEEATNEKPMAAKQPNMLGAGIVTGFLLIGATILGYGIDSNTPWPVTANTTIAPKHCMGTILAGTGSTGQFTLTLPTVTGFPSNCSVLIKNGDTTNGKILAGFPPDVKVILYPSQSIGIKIVNGTWQSFYNPGPWSPSTSSWNGQLYAAPSGVDTNDCLTSGTACTFKGACQILLDYLFANGRRHQSCGRHL